MTLIQNVITSMLDIIQILFISKKILQHNKHNKLYKLIIAVFLFAILNGFLSYYLESQYRFFISIILIIIIIKILYYIKIFESSYIFLIAFIIQTLLQFIPFMFSKYIYSIEDDFLYNIVGQCISMIFILILYLYVPIDSLYKPQLIKNKTFIIIVSNIFVIIVGCILYYYLYSEDFIINILSVATILLMIVFINILLFTNNLKNIQEQKQLEIYQKYLPIIDELISEIKGKQHEYDNHIQAMTMVLNSETRTEEKISSLKSYVGDVDFSKSLGNLGKLNNPIVAGIIYSKQKICEEKGIEINIEISNYYIKTELRDYELVEILGILLNNAIEACTKGMNIKLYIDKEKDMNIIKILNEHTYLTSQQIEKIFKKGYSTKDNQNRGFGLFNLSKIINRYGGKCIVENTIINNKNYIAFIIYFR